MSEAQRLVALGNAIQALRAERSLSSAALAAAAGVDDAQLASLEAGQLDADFDLLLKVANGLGTSVSTIVTRAEEPAT